MLREKLRSNKDGRPTEIEAWTNLRLVHPASRFIVPYLYQIRLSPNSVSIIGTLFAVLAGVCFLLIPAPWGGLAAIVLLFWRHVFDGADGLLARYTGQASAKGDIIDGLCDALALVGVHAALAIHFFKDFGVEIALPVAVAGIFSYALQARTYEATRRQYLYWTRGRAILTSGAPGEDRIPNNEFNTFKAVWHLYFDARGIDSAQVTNAMEAAQIVGGNSVDHARNTYKRYKKTVVTRCGVLGENQKTIATGAAMVMGSSALAYVYLIVAANIFLIGLLIWRRSVDIRLCRALSAQTIDK